jgi:thiol:disulfide interchange protein
MDWIVYVKLLYALVLLAVAMFLAWVATVRVRRRIRRATGKRVSDIELNSSIATWMEVSEAEQRKAPPNAPPKVNGRR